MDIKLLNREEIYRLEKALLERKEEIRQEELNAKREAATDFLNKLRENKEVILSLINHGRTSCSDEKVSNGYGTSSYGARCDKCHLIEILNDEWNSDFEVSFQISISRID